MNIERRGFLTGIIALCAAPAIVRVGSIMPVKVMPDDLGSVEDWFGRYELIQTRESLMDMIYNVKPTETPFFLMARNPLNKSRLREMFPGH